MASCDVTISINPNGGAFCQFYIGREAAGGIQNACVNHMYPLTTIFRLFCMIYTFFIRSSTSQNEENVFPLYYSAYASALWNLTERESETPNGNRIF